MHACIHRYTRLVFVCVSARVYAATRPLSINCEDARDETHRWAHPRGVRGYNPDDQTLVDITLV